MNEMIAIMETQAAHFLQRVLGAHDRSSNYKEDLLWV